MTRKRFIKLLMGRCGFSRNEARVIASMVPLLNALFADIECSYADESGWYEEARGIDESKA